jgi:hypothetical protein
MSPEQIAALLDGLVKIVTAIGVIVVAYFAYRAKVEASRAARIADDLQAPLIRIGDQVLEVGDAIDGRLTALLKSETSAARLEGVAAGEQAQRDRQAPPT